jgi:hypothetical protein
MQSVLERCEAIRRFGQKVGPYLMLEMLLPGGTLFVLLLFVYRRWKAAGGRPGFGLRFAPILIPAKAGR